MGKVKLNLVKVITSLATEFEIDSVVLHGVEVNYEKHSYSQPSNVQEIIDYVEAQMKNPDEAPKDESLARSPSTYKKSPSKYKKAEEETDQNTEQEGNKDETKAGACFRKAEGLLHCDCCKKDP